MIVGLEPVQQAGNTNIKVMLSVTMLLAPLAALLAAYTVHTQQNPKYILHMQQNPLP